MIPAIEQFPKILWTKMFTSFVCYLFSDALGHEFQPPPPRRELPSARLLRKAFLLSESEHIEDYRAQIMSTFGKILKFDSTKKVWAAFNFKGSPCLVSSTCSMLRGASPLVMPTQTGCPVVAGWTTWKQCQCTQLGEICPCWFGPTIVCSG